MNHEKFLSQTIVLAAKNVEENGGPFGAIVVNQHGEIIGSGSNKVTQNNDPTAHAEIQAIREACEKLNTFQLSDCILYTSCEPCPMCLGAIYWSRVEKVYYAADQKLAAEGGFDDAFIYEEIAKKHEDRKIPFYSLSLTDKNLPFEKWAKNELKLEY
ncbi:tRNA-specific adenosine deaminase [Aquibacillus halophilus]|uniref:tRNA-specific adenosine deaminase n=1 Tax=Aquibacillus halophilus TaxID=930132 RepID=A0A6A8DND5_9BACI|nr:tRNA-specific adenosine deaminase [Aquibacillus halophilus]